MSICPITYTAIGKNAKYSKKGLHLLSPRLNNLNDLPLTAKEQRQAAKTLMNKMSIQGVQLKLSAILNIKEEQFELVKNHGKYILKPQSDLYLQVPENEDLSMRLASVIGIETPLHGLLYSIDGSLTYFIKRFDRYSRNKKIAVEDFAQLSGSDRDTKYNSSMEKLIPIIEDYCTFPQLEKTKLFLRILFNFLIGNEDMHLKNFSLISRNNKVELSPAYDYVNSTIILNSTKEEIALPLNGKKRNLNQKDFIDYYAIQKLQMNEKIILQEIKKIENAMPLWQKLIDISFLSSDMKQKYRELLRKNWGAIKL